jgi:hypothetical protein
VEPIALTYDAPPGCRTADEFQALVLARTARIRFAAPGEAARTFEVHVDRDGGVVRGRLDVHGRAGQATRREISGDSCDDVVSALAFVTALAVDPDARRAEGQAKFVTSEPEADVRRALSEDAGVSIADAAVMIATATATPTAATTAATTATATPTPTATATPTATPSTTTSSTPRLAPLSPWSTGARAETILGLLPTWVAGGAVFVDWAAAGLALVAPSMRLSLMTFESDPAFPYAISGHFGWIAGRVEGCPVRVRLGARWLVVPCFGLEGGALIVHGAGGVLASSTLKTMPWVALDPLVRASWEPVDRVRLELGVGMAIPLTPYSFGFDQPNAQRVVAYPSRAVGADVSLGVAYVFP